MHAVDLVVCDIAGTTVKDQDAVGTCVQQALAAAGVTLTIEQINPIMGLPKPIAIQMLLEQAGSDLDVTPIHADFVERMLDYYRTSPDVAPIDGVLDAIAMLRDAGVKVALDTGFTANITETILERLGWDESVIDGVVSSDQVKEGRPSPDMIRYLMERFGIEDPMRVAKVGDAPADMCEGTNAGCRFVIGVLSGTHTEEQLAKEPHTHIVGSLSDLPDLLLERRP